MTAVPIDTSRIILADEVDAARPWADRHGWNLELGPGDLLLTVRMRHPADQMPLLLRGDFSGYRALPPTWVFLDPGTEQPGPHAWPAPGPVGGQASIFHPTRIICSHFNRKAYASEGGPHAWGTLTSWVAVRQGVHAENVGEMLAAIGVHLRCSPGRMG